MSLNKSLLRIYKALIFAIFMKFENSQGPPASPLCLGTLKFVNSWTRTYTQFSRYYLNDTLLETLGS